MVLETNRNTTRPRCVVLCERCKQAGCERAATGKSVREDVMVDRHDCPDCQKAQRLKGNRAGAQMSQEEKLKLRTYNTTSDKEKRDIWRSILKQNGKTIMHS
jgi:hypothetical protein